MPGSTPSSEVVSPPAGIAAVGEWPDGLRVADLRKTGWAPTPFRQFILKVHGRCNLACRYCYVYEMADQSWRDKPRSMPRGTVVRTAQRIAEHAQRHDLDEVEVVLHGGEPLLYGVERLADSIDLLREHLPTSPTVRLHTNGVLLSEPVLDMLRERHVRIGVSLDGASTTNDVHRIFPSGRGSYAPVARGIRLLSSEPYRALFSGLLCTIHPHSDPVQTLSTLNAFSPPRIDFLLPHANWSRPPRECIADRTPYADWLIAVFDRWHGMSRGRPSVRLFEEIIHLLLGGSSASENIGLSPVALVVIDTDGSIEQIDTLKSAYPGAPQTGLSVFSDPFDTALDLPAVAARQIGLRALGATCRECTVHRVCGAGHYAHRYRPDSGFRNPSVYCADLYKLITHIHDRLRSDIQRLTEGRM